MQKIGDTARFREIERSIILEGFDPISAGGFTQVPNAVLKDTKVSSSAKLIYALLLSYAWHNNYCFPGQKRLGDDAGVSERSIRNNLNELEEAGYISVKQRGLGKPNLYTLHAQVKPKLDRK